MKKSPFGIHSAATIILLLGLSHFTHGQESLIYQLPPEAIIEVVDARQTPSVYLSPDNSFVALLERPGLKTIEDLSREELRIAGLRIDPATNGASRKSYQIGISIMKIDGTGLKKVTGLPSNLKISGFTWSNDGSKFAFTNTTTNSIELWICDVSDLKAEKIADGLNQVLVRGGRFSRSGGFAWLSDNKSIIFQVLDSERGARPKPSSIPTGPVVQENMGKRGAARTFQDLLKNPGDEMIFEYFASSKLMKYDGSGITQIGSSGIYSRISPSPDGLYFMVAEVLKPFSYVVPYYYFPTKTSIWDGSGKELKVIYDMPLRENLPRGFDVVFPGPRSFGWRADKPATAYWVEALDEGNPKNEVDFRDQVYTLDAPFQGDPVDFIATKTRFSNITWGNENFAILYEGMRKDRLQIVSSFNPSNPMASKKLMMEYKTDDRYGNPGRFYTSGNSYGRRVLLFTNKSKSLILRGQGSSPEGDRPFIRKYDIKSGETTELWRSEAPFYESVQEIIDIKKNLVITSRQSKELPPNYYLRNLKTGKITAITKFKNPYPSLAGVSKELVKYKRADGIDLTFTLYLPAGYNVEKDGPLPTLLWAYPREYEDAKVAGQVSGSPYSFTRVSAGSILSYVTQGYAILNNAAFPIVGEGDVKPNDGFVEQLVANAEAVINKAAEMGVTDPERVAVGGHSYGAFMTANLLTHSRLFAAGIAESGAYNRTLTPFGFQSERRSYWEAPELYYAMSPFMHADLVKDPMLLIHGIADNNSGTFPIQSQRYFSALKGHGVTVRLVMLPMESHGYAARESLLHKHWETLEWLKKYVKDKK